VLYFHYYEYVKQTQKSTSANCCMHTTTVTLRCACYRCNPIAEVDLATYLVDCVKEPQRNNQILDLGGPDAGYTMAQQGELLAEACGVKPNIMKAPVALFDAIIGGLDFVGKAVPAFADGAELARIGKYYAVEDMLTTEPDQKFGTITLKQHYERIAREGQGECCCTVAALYAY
jgi:divinyl chlorophyllide a 8-vinyl-reductase